VKPIHALPTTRLLAMRLGALPALREHIEHLLRSRGLFLPVVIGGRK
jgi:hypothetical protein